MVDHLLYYCILPETQRRILRNVTKNGQWPVNKHELITKHLEPIITYIESIDFDLLEKIKNTTQFITMLELINRRKTGSSNNRN
jgi:type IV secretory pathway TrbL component